MSKKNVLKYQYINCIKLQKHVCVVGGKELILLLLLRLFILHFSSLSHKTLLLGITLTENHRKVTKKIQPQKKCNGEQQQQQQQHYYLIISPFHSLPTFESPTPLSLTLLFLPKRTSHKPQTTNPKPTSLITMMAEKHLRDLLLEDQEPFLLKHYISDRRTLLKRTSPNTTLRKNTSNSNFPLNKCLLSFHNATKSPLLEFAPPTKKESQLRPSNAKTATLLLEAALRIHKHAKPKPNRAFGIFGSLFKKLKNQRTREHINNDVRVAVVGSCEGRPSSSGVWSESNEDKSLDLETCSSGHSFDDSVEQEIQFVNTRKLNSHDLFFCQTPFRFSLQRSPDYSPRRTPEFSSPLASPCRHTTQVAPFHIILLPNTFFFPSNKNYFLLLTQLN